MSFEWDEASKAGINYLKHGVPMPEAIPVSARLAEAQEREQYEAER